MKNIFLNITLLTFSISLFAQIDRSIPEPNPAPQINFEEPISFEMKNGLKVMLIENHKLPRVSINLLIDNPPIFEGDLNGIVKARNLSEKVMKNIKQNLFFALIYNTIGVPIAAGVLYPFFGILLSPMIAALAMSFSSVSVIANALRLRHIKI